MPSKDLPMGMQHQPKAKEEQDINPDWYIISSIAGIIVTTTMLYFIFAFGNYSLNTADWSDVSRFTISVLVFVELVFWVSMLIEMYNGAVAIRNLELTLEINRAARQARLDKEDKDVTKPKKA